MRTNQPASGTGPVGGPAAPAAALTGRQLPAASRAHALRQARALSGEPSDAVARAGDLDPPVLLAACGGDPTMLRKMCRALQSRVPEHLAAVRDALHDQDALRLREAAHKFYGMLSAFSTVAGDQAASLEDLTDRGLLNEALPVVEQLDECATELARLAGGLTIETLRKQAGPAGDP